MIAIGLGNLALLTYGLGIAWTIRDHAVQYFPGIISFHDKEKGVSFKAEKPKLSFVEGESESIEFSDKKSKVGFKDEQA